MTTSIFAGRRSARRPGTAARWLAGAALLLALAPAGAGAANLVRDPGFDEGGAGRASDAWPVDPKARHKGRVEVVQVPGQGAVLRLRPNERNVAAERDTNPLSVYQTFDPAKRPDLRGATLHLRAQVGARGPAQGVVRLIAIRRDNQFLGVRLERPDGDGRLATLSGQLRIPDDDRNILVLLSLSVDGTSGEALFDDVYVGFTPPPAPAAAASSPGPTPTPATAASGRAEIRVDAGRRLREIPDTLYGTNLEWIWDGNGLWDARAGSLNEDLVRLARELGPTVLRFPGGLFADFYHWRDGTGPQSRRPRRPHMPEGPVSRHSFGTDEALELARRIGARLMITVNISTGTAQEAVDWLRYVNRPSETRGEPPRVPYWEVGNENYYRGDAPYLRASGLSAREYAERFLTFARALRDADPRIRIGAIAQEDFARDFRPVQPDWLPTLLSRAGHDIDFLSIHNGYVPNLTADHGWDVRTVYRAMMAAPILVRESLDRVAAAVRRHAPRYADRIRLAVTEWGPSFQSSPDGRFVDHPKTLGSALFVASNLKTYIEHPQTDYANFFKLADALWLGWIGPRRGRFVPKAPYYAFQLYRRHFGSVLVRSATTSPTFDAPAVGYVGATTGVPYLDAVASLSRDGSRLYLMVVNRSFDEPITARIDIAGFAPRRGGRAFVLEGTGLDANTGTELFRGPGVHWARQAEDERNPRFARGGPGEVRIREAALGEAGPRFEHRFAPRSVTAIELDRR